MRKLSLNNTKTILVIEDTPAIRLVLIEVLEMDGHKVVAVENGKEALDYLAVSQIPALIFLDIFMPVMDGQQFLRILRSDILFSSVPVAVMSANRDAEKSKDADYFLKKPFDIENVLSLAKKYCS